ncbi:MAG: caspase family protein [Cyanobacteria bacterium P01_A01_bin.17]
MTDSQPTARRAEVVTALFSEYKNSNRWAIIIGISEYKHKNWNLRYADRDAEEFCKLLQTPNGGGFRPEYIYKLTNSDATTRKITKALRSFLQKPARKDLVIVYLACHGAPDLNRPDNVYLLTHDTDPSDVAGTGLPMREIELALNENLLAEKVVIIADTCHSAAIGGSMGRRSTSDETALVNRYLREVSKAKDGMALLTSAEANEVSFEDKKWGGGHGVFTYFLLEGMRGAADRDQNGIVSIGELFEYVRDKVKQATDHKQHPSIGTNFFDRNLPVSINPEVGEPESLNDRLIETSLNDNPIQPKTLISTSESSHNIVSNLLSTLPSKPIVWILFVVTGISLAGITLYNSTLISKSPKDEPLPEVPKTDVDSSVPSEKNQPNSPSESAEVHPEPSVPSEKNQPNSPSEPSDIQTEPSVPSEPIQSRSTPPVAQSFSTPGLQIWYFQQQDSGQVKLALSALPIDPTPKSGAQRPQTNAIWFGENVTLEDVKLVARELIQAGIPIQAIRPFSGSGRKPSRIDIGADGDIPEATPIWTVEQINNATEFSR